MTHAFFYRVSIVLRRIYSTVAVLWCAETWMLCCPRIHNRYRSTYQVSRSTAFSFITIRCMFDVSGNAASMLWAHTMQVQPFPSLWNRKMVNISVSVISHVPAPSFHRRSIWHVDSPTRCLRRRFQQGVDTTYHHQFSSSSYQMFPPPLTSSFSFT